jgi:hypothetical protein
VSTLIPFTTCVGDQKPGAKPTIECHNASAVKIYNATVSLVRFESKNIFFDFEKRSSLLQRWHCNLKFRSHGIGSSLKFPSRR